MWDGDGQTVAMHDVGGAVMTALHGLSGIGKSELARRYAWTRRERYEGLWWLRADSVDTLVDDLVALGRRFVAGIDAEDPADGARTTLDWLAQSGSDKPWLLVYDNVDSLELFRDWTPTIMCIS